LRHAVDHEGRERLLRVEQLQAAAIAAAQAGEERHAVLGSGDDHRALAALEARADILGYRLGQAIDLLVKLHEMVVRSGFLEIDRHGSNALTLERITSGASGLRR
jgi:hypothetical protein